MADEWERREKKANDGTKPYNKMVETYIKQKRRVKLNKSEENK